MDTQKTTKPALSSLLLVTARLLDYPTQARWDNAREICTIIRLSPYIPPELRLSIITDLKGLFANDIYECQARYDGLFDRGRSVSLSLFEHVHGESRDRGQAMVDLLNVYQQNGLVLNSEQMPDYIPLFLEFLSTQDEATIRQWLDEVSHILTLLAERLRQREAWETKLFEALLIIAGHPVQDESIQRQVADEDDDQTPEAIDKAWEDREIRFDEPLLDGAQDGCNPIAKFQQINGEQPITWDKLQKKKNTQEVSS